ncbi:hypothetical protein [Microbacterium mangrovi]|nr:hypothetical protein [Microbacterium mangrovi]
MTDTIARTERRAQTGSRTAWRVLGALVLVHFALLFTSITFEAMVDPAATPAQVAHAYAHIDPALASFGMYLETGAFLVFAVAAALAFRLFATRPGVARHAATAFIVLATAYVAATIAVGFPPAVAAIHAAHLGADPVAIAMVNNIRNAGYVLQVATYAAATIALGVSSIAGRTRVWWGWGAAIIGTLTLIAGAVDPNLPGMLTMAWWVVLAVSVLVRPPVARAAVATPDDKVGDQGAL